MDKPSIDVRNRKLVEALNTGEHTLQQMADEYGVSRERIRQIYHKLSHHGFSTRRIKAKNDKLHAIAFRCSACHKEVEKMNVKNKRKLCLECSNMNSVLRRNPYVVSKCDQCSKFFHPFRNRKYMPSRVLNFCNSACYHKYSKAD